MKMSKIRVWRGKVLALLLAVVMVLTLAPLTAHADPDAAPPTVLNVTPYGVNSPDNRGLVITFSEEMDVMWEGSVFLAKDGSAYGSLLSAHPGMWSDDATVVTIPSPDMIENGTEYNAFISGFKDASGNEMDYCIYPLNIDIPTYTVTVISDGDTGGSIDGHGEYLVGEEIYINAGTLYGYKFTHWTSDSPDVVFDDENDRIAYFTMPAHPVTVTAHFELDLNITSVAGQNIIYNGIDEIGINGDLVKIINVSVDLPNSVEKIGAGDIGMAGDTGMSWFMAFGSKAALNIALGNQSGPSQIMLDNIAFVSQDMLEQFLVQLSGFGLDFDNGKTIPLTAGEATHIYFYTATQDGSDQLYDVTINRAGIAPPKNDDDDKTPPLTTLPNTTIEPPVPMANIPAVKSFVAPGMSAALPKSVTFSDGTSADVTWTSGNPAVAKIDAGGNIVAVGEGKATLTARAADGKAQTITVTVAKPVTAVRTPLTKIYLQAGKPLTPPVCADSVNAVTKKAETTAKLTWKSSKPKIAAVNPSTGKITSKKPGKATITATALNGKKLTIKVTVVKKATLLKKVTLTKPPKSLKAGKTALLKIKTSPAKATNLNVTFRSSKPKIIQVDKAGKLTALKKGKAKITVKIGNRKYVREITVK
jgi:uncharacterized protein YjdB